MKAMYLENTKKSFVGLHGVCCVTYPEYLRKGSLLGKNVGYSDKK